MTTEPNYIEHPEHGQIFQSKFTVYAARGEHIAHKVIVVHVQYDAELGDFVLTVQAHKAIEQTKRELIEGITNDH